MDPNDNNNDQPNSKKAPTEQEGALSAIPEQVVNVDAYKKWLNIKDSPILKLPNRLIDTSDVELQIDPMMHRAAINQKILHLPGDEQADILRRVKAVNVLRMRVVSLQEKAYSTKRRKHHKSLQMGLLDERSSELIEYFGHLMEDREVHKVVNNEWGYEVSLRAITNFRRRNKDKIEVVKDQYIKDHTSIRLSHKKGRLEELQKLYLNRKAKYDSTQTKDDYRLLLMTLKELREETRDETLRIEANINQNINLTIQNHIEKEVMNSLTINDIILARVAQRMDVNPRFLISRLHTSFYAKHSGFAAPDGDLDQQAPMYPSAMVYNWNDIKKQHDSVGDANIEDAQWEEVPKEKLSQAQTLKEVIAQKIKDKQAKVSEASDRAVDRAK